MASTYTLNNGIELIGTGEQSGTWGDTTNTNFELLDTSLDGQVSVTLSATGSTGSPNTLPVSDGAASNGRNRLVIFGDGGDIGGTVYVQLTPNDAEKIIYVRNNLSGSRSILLFQGTYNASNDYEVPAGTTAVVFFNGAGSGAVAANVFNNAHFDALNIIGAAAVGTTLTVGTSLNIASSTTVNGVLDEDNMASNSATKLSTQQSIKAYVDSQVGTVDTLAEILANGNTTGGNTIVFGDSSGATDDRLVFGAGSDLQIYHSGSHSFIDDAGTGDLYIRSNNILLQKYTGESMITAAADAAVTLHYDNSAKLATTATGISVTGKLETSADNNAGAKANYIRITDTDTTATANNQAGGIEFYTNDVTPGIAASIEVLYAGTGGGGELTFNTNASSSGTLTEAVRIDENGNVGIGTSSPSSTQRLHVYNASSGVSTVSTNTDLTVENSANTGISLLTPNTSNGQILFGDPQDNDVGRIQYNHPSNYMAFFTNASERLRIDSSGTAFLGKTAAGNAAGIELNQSGSAYLVCDSAAVLLLNRLGTDGTVVQFYNDSNGVGSISVSGSNTAYNTSSDYRLKTDVQPMTGASARVQALNPVNFAWIADGTRVDGFLAHEAATVVPESIYGSKDAMRDEEYEVTPEVLDDDGNVTTAAVMGTRSVPDYQGIDQSKLVPLLTAALQEALTKIDSLETRLTALEE
jgi:hypothetical protein